MMLKEEGKVTLTFQVEVDTGQGSVLCVLAGLFHRG